jgi:hypothetical protein
MRIEGVLMDALSLMPFSYQSSFIDNSGDGLLINMMTVANNFFSR